MTVSVEAGVLVDPDVELSADEGLDS